MSSEGTGVFTKENLDTLLKELAKEFKKRNTCISEKSKEAAVIGNSGSRRNRSGCWQIHGKQSLKSLLIKACSVIH